MTELSRSAVANEAFCERRNADPKAVKPSGLKNIVKDATADEISVALAKLRARTNGIDPTE
jgi:hypothetical protein